VAMKRGEFRNLEEGNRKTVVAVTGELVKTEHTKTLGVCHSEI
jgi:hypothetical protein